VSAIEDEFGKGNGFCFYQLDGDQPVPFWNADCNTIPDRERSWGGFFPDQAD
jgi:hypothetical protein